MGVIKYYIKTKINMGRSISKLGQKLSNRERKQPMWRSRLGFLQKHKDYVIRARAFHQRKNQINALRKKAQFRNPDEFYTQMINSHMKDGVHFPRQSRRTKERMKELIKLDIAHFNVNYRIEIKKLKRISIMYNHLHENSKQKLFFETMNQQSLFLQEFSKEKKERKSLEENLIKDKKKNLEQLRRKRVKEIEIRKKRIVYLEQILTRLKLKLKFTSKKKYKKIKVKTKEGRIMQYIFTSEREK